jgi:hypothetical protein
MQNILLRNTTKLSSINRTSQNCHNFEIRSNNIILHKANLKEMSFKRGQSNPKHRQNSNAYTELVLKDRSEHSSCNPFQNVKYNDCTFLISNVSHCAVYNSQTLDINVQIPSRVQNSFHLIDLCSVQSDLNSTTVQQYNLQHAQPTNCHRRLLQY